MADRSPRIAIVSHTHPDLSKGGAEVSAYALFKGLKALGQDVIFVATCDESDLPRVKTRPGEYLIQRDTAFYDHFYQLGTPETARQLTEILAREKVEVVNFQHYLFLGINAIEAVCDMGLRVVVTLHEYLAICHHHGQMVTRPGKALCRAASRQGCQACYPEHLGEEFDIRRWQIGRAFDRVAAFVSPSAFLRGRYAAWGLDPARVSVIENGLLDIDAKRARAAAEAGRSRAPRSEAATIGYFGQITPFKGVGLILDLVEQVEDARDAARAAGVEAPPRPPFRFRIHGNLVGLDPAFVERFEAAEKRSPALRYMGAYANEDVVTLMAGCDYVIVPSQWWENSPVVIQEAYAAGCPVIASDLGGLAEKVVEGETGLLFAVSDATSLLATLEAACAPGALDKLQAGLPAVSDDVAMARAYLNLLAGPESAAEPGDAAVAGTPATD
ncbi:glycosyltransferase family 4 protein [Mesobacterium pallidum]|uniref:glycosyltransferase family 4 protein n=1 Tax=Mesobacterium pallidum TaxID=2872037 RepID=UPI001EE3049F|nr:glycosyltransferase family 4 protein [Mesobacterium pallidum]